MPRKKQKIAKHLRTVVGIDVPAFKLAILKDSAGNYWTKVGSDTLLPVSRAEALRTYADMHRLEFMAGFISKDSNEEIVALLEEVAAGKE